MSCKIKSQRPSDIKTKAFGPKNIDHETNLDNISEKGLNEQLLKTRCIDAIAFNMVGRIYYDQGQYDKAKDSFKQSLRITTEVFGFEHVKRATTLYNLGLVFYDTAEYDKAKDFYEQALEIETKAFGPEHNNVAITYNNLGLVYYDTAEYDKAKDFYRKALEIETKRFGPDHINVATTYNNLGLVYYDTAEYDKAKDFYRKALELETKVFGPDHINVATTYNNLGLVYYDTAEYDKAKDFYEQALELETKVFGPDHINVATTYNNLGLVYYDTAEYDKAKDFYEQALKIETKTFGPDQINVATTYNNLGLVYKDMGEYEKAKDFYEQAIEIETKAFGPDHVNIATTYNNLGLVYHDMKQYEKAKDFYERAIELETKAFGHDHINTATTYRNLGLVYFKMLDYKKAKDFYEQAIEIETKAFGPDHVKLATTYNNLGSVYRKMEEYKKAEGFFERAIKIQMKAFGPDHVNIATTYDNLGSVYTEIGEYEKAKEIYQKSLEIKTKNFGYNHSNTATTYNNLGSVYLSNGEYAKARDLYKQAIDIQAKIAGSDHVFCAAMCNNLGFVYMRLEEYDKAKDLYKRALDINSIAEFVNMAATFNNLGCAYSHLKEYEMAKHYFERALLIKTKMSIPNQPFNKGTILGNLLSVCSVFGENDKTKYLSEHALEFEIDQIYSSCKEINEVDSCQLIDNIKLLPDSTLYGLEYRKQGIDCTVKEMKDSDLTGDTTTKMKKSYTIPDDDIENDDNSFIENFLDEYYGIRDEIHDILSSFSWIRGGYGVRWKPRLSLYVTVAAERQNDEDALRKEIDETFRWKASPYFEFEPEPKKSRFRWLSDLEVVKKENSFNPLTGKIGDECETRAKGTVTMFCIKESTHYALTCFHTSCITDRRVAGYEFNFSEDWKEVKQIYETISTGVITDENEYYYHPLMDDEIKLGSPCRQSFNENTDIMAIEVIDEEMISCDHFTIEEPGWKEIRKSIADQLREGGASVTKYDGGVKGEILDITYTHKCPETDRIIFKNVTAIKCERPFLKEGDSGVLIYFYDEVDESHIAYGYGVCAHERDDETIYLVFGLNDALKHLNLEKCYCYM